MLKALWTEYPHLRGEGVPPDTKGIIMYPECRHVKSDGCKCGSPAVDRSHWCYYHTTLHKRRLKSIQRRPLRAEDHATLDYGAIPATDPKTDAIPGLRLPDLEDAGAIQFALTDVLQALALGTLDPRRAGLLLYGLQVAAGISKQVSANAHSVRAITYAEDGSALGPKVQSWDVEDYNLDDEEEEEDTEDAEDVATAAE